ncbi:MAG: amidohydrolase family protein [Planctomycetota bacterium]
MNTHNITTRVAAAVAACITMAASAQDLLHKAPPQTQAILLTGGTVHTVSGDTIENGAVLFDDGVIAEVGTADSVSAPADARTIDIAGHHVYPGLISSVTQQGLVEVGAVRATRDYSEVGVASPEVVAVSAVNPDSTLLPVARLNGVLIAGVVPEAGLRMYAEGGPRGVMPGQASIVNMDGWTNDDMTIDRHAGLVVNVPITRTTDASWMDRSEREQRRAIDATIGLIDSMFEDAEVYRANAEAGIEQTTDLRLAAMQPYLASAGDEQKPVWFNANDHDQIIAALNIAARHDLDPIIVGGRDAHLIAPLLAEHDAGVILITAYRPPRRDDSPFDQNYLSAQALTEAGVRWCFDIGDRDGNVRNLPYAVALCVAHGLPREDGIRSITLAAAEVLGIDDRFGSIDAGKSATLIVTDGDPLEIATNVRYAFIDGREIELRSKQTDLRDKYTEKYRQLGIIDED